MCFSLMPLSTAFFTAGNTLHKCQVDPQIAKKWSILRWICRINDDRIFRFVVRHKIGIIVARALPFYVLAIHIQLTSLWLLTHWN